MDITITLENDLLTVAPVGRLDSASAPNLEAQIKERIANATTLVFDLKGLEYTSSAGLRILLNAQKIMAKQGKMIVKNVNDTVMEVLELTGFTEFLTIE